MSNNWYSSSWTGGSSGNSSSYYNNDYNQCEGSEYGGENFSIGNNIGNFIGNRGGFNLGYGATENNGNFRRNYEPRYGEGAISNNRESYSEHFRGGYEQRYGHNASSNNRSNDRRNYEQRPGENTRSSDILNYEQRSGDTRSKDKSSYRENYEQRYGEDARSNKSSNCRGNYEQRYGENIRSNDSANYSDSGASFGNNVQGSHCGINDTGNNRDRYNGHERRTHSDWTGHYYSGDGASRSDGQNKVEESYSSRKNIQDCLLEGSIVVVKQQRGRPKYQQTGRPKYQCLHCKITFFNEDHIEKKGHLGHVEHCLDVRACFEATVGKRGFGINFKKLSSHTSEGLKSEKVKTVPYQNAYEDYIEKDIKEGSEKIKQEVKEESFGRDVTGGGFKVNNLKAISTKEKVIIKDDVDIKKEFKMKTEMDIKKKGYFRCNLEMLKKMTSQERVKNYITNQIKEEAFSDINLNKEIIKTEMGEKYVPENNEKHQDQEYKSYFVNRITKEETTNFTERPAKKTKKEFYKRLKEKKKKKMALKRVKDRERNEEKDKAILDKEVKAVTRWDQYACLKPECLQTFQVWGDARRHMKQGCLPTAMTKKGWRFTVKPNMGQSSEKALNQRGMGTSMMKRVAAENEEKLIEAARNFYAENRNLRLYPHPKQVARHLRETYGGFGLPPARIHQIVKSLSKP